MRHFCSLFCCLIVYTLFLNGLSASAKNVRRTRAAATDFVYIVNSGNGPISGYRVYVASSGRLSAVYFLRGGRRSTRHSGTLSPVVSRRFFADLALASPVNKLASSARPDTAPTDDAPGIHIYVLYHGHQSPDLRLSASSAGESLYQDVKQAIQAVRLPVPNTP